MTLSIFNSHSWDYSDDRSGVIRLLSPWIKYLDWIDLAIPEAHPLPVNDDAILKLNLSQRILGCDVFLMFAGIYSSHSDWIEFEVRTAWRLMKPIIAIRPRSQQNLSQLARRHADQIVGWNSISIRNAIKASIPTHRWAEVGPQLLERERQALVASFYKANTIAPDRLQR